MRFIFAPWFLILFSVSATAQTAAIRVQVRAGDVPVQGAEVSAADQIVKSDAAGIALLTVNPGETTVVVIKDGFVAASVPVTVQAGQQREVIVDLVAEPSVKETVVVSATRTGGRLEDQPLRVEVLEREEIEEKMLMTPGDIVMMLNEMGGMRVQATSPSLGAASVRVQGMRGRYTRFLSDGLPLFGEVGGLGLLQIPPMDLGQVEVIKGTASSLYGAGAMGGVVNLISRIPGADASQEFLLNRSSRGATDAIGFFGGPISSTWGYTLLASTHFQERMDVDDDTWSDLPNYARAVARPRLFWNDGKGNRFFATAGATIEDRKGGTAEDEILPAAGVPYVEALDTRGYDGGLLDQRLLGGKYVLTTRATFSQKQHDHQFGEVFERDRHATGFGEVTVRGNAGPHTWVAGAAIERDRYRNDDVPRFNYAFTVPGVFAQDDIAMRSWLSISGSVRVDHHSEYGTFLSPRVSALVRSGDWNSRASIGTGFFGPSALTEETEAAGLTRLSMPGALEAEKGRSASWDLTRSSGPLSATLTLFASRVADSIKVDRETSYAIRNAEETRTNGVELLGTFRHEPYALTGAYTYVKARELDGGVRSEVALTPRHSTGLVGMWEREDIGRVGIELYYTGRQRLEVNPYASQSEPYFILGLLGERQFGRLRLFINGENLTGVRQTTWDPLIRPARAVDGRWTVDAWAPLEGRNVNGGIRVTF
jgi:outer membrane receptor for ferrienterochelin and colicins